MMTLDRYQLFADFKKFKNELEQEHDYSVLCYKGIDLVDCLLMPIYLSLLHQKNDIREYSFNLFKAAYYYYKDGRLLNKYISLLGTNLKNITPKEFNTPIIFFPFNPAHLDYHLPLYQLLKQQQSSFLILTTNGLVYRKLTKSGYTPYFVSLHKKEGINEFHEKMDNFFKNAPLQLRNNFDNELIKIEKYLKTYSDILISFLDEIDQFLGLSNASNIIIGNDLTFQGRALALLAMKRKINTVSLMHGVITGEPMDACHIVDQFLVFGEKSKNELIRIGINSQKLIITGTPFFDNFKKQTGVIHNNIRKNANITKGQKYILFAHSGPGHCTTKEHFDTIVTALINASIDLPQHRFIVKLHPKDQLVNYKELLTKYPDHRLTIVKHGNPNYPPSFLDWLQGCNLLITGTSAAAQEAMLYEIPVITIDLKNEYSHVDFIDEGATIHVTESEELSTVINNVFMKPEMYNNKKENAQSYVEQSFYKLDGRASERCLNVILKS